MIKRRIASLAKQLLFCTAVTIAPLALPAQPAGINLKIDGSVRYQTMDGFGVNVNPAWWYDGEYRDTKVLKPAIDLLVDSLGATIYRAVIEEIDWEAVNDDNDPGHFNWTYYDSVFSGARFRGVWNSLQYLNQKGITNGLVISFMGGAPASPPLAPPDPAKSWMGGTDYSIAVNMEDELVESMAAMLYYMRHKANVQFSLVSPMNETDVISMSHSAEHPNGIVEGPNMPDPVQYVRVIRKLALKLDSIGMSDVHFVAPDAAGEKLFNGVVNEMIKDPYLMSKLACWGVHQYGSDAANYLNIVKQPGNPDKSFWVTETAGIGNLMGQLDDNARSYIFWDGYDCVYQHGRRNGYGSVPPNDWAFWFASDEGKPMIEYVPSTNSWKPRKQFYQFSQVMKFVRPGAVRIGVSGQDTSLVVDAYRNPDGQTVILGMYKGKRPIDLNGKIANLPVIKNMKMFYTNSTGNLLNGSVLSVSGESFRVTIPPDCIFTLTGIPESGAVKGTGRGTFNSLRTEPKDWYAGDIHIHRNCGDVTPITPEESLIPMMEQNDLAVISMLADMGNGEVKDSHADLPKVTGRDAAYSVPGRLVHWDAEWHFDPAGVTFDHKALGGHLVLLGLKEAHQIWDESPYKILEWGKSQGAVSGFCHMQYLNDKIQNELTCCIPVDYPVEAALGTIDFLSEDVWLNDAAVNAYYKILNCGFRIGWAAGTDFPCNNSRPIGSLLTYVQIKDQPITYRKWIDGIKNGRTVVTTNGHVEFLNLKINGTSGPGDEIKMKEKKPVEVDVVWSSSRILTGKIEIVCNGKVVASQEGTAMPDLPVHLKAMVPVGESSWICARRMDDTGHQSHTAPVYISLNDKPVRASAEDADYFVKWIDNIILNIAPGGPWNQYFTHDLETVQKRYQKARAVYAEIALEASAGAKR